MRSTPRKEGPTAKETAMAQSITDIAMTYLDIETLETRNSDELDFYGLAVWEIKEALQAAYRAGRRGNRPEH